MMSTSTETTKMPQSFSRSCSSAASSPTRKRKPDLNDMSSRRRRELKKHSRSSSSTNSTDNDNADAERLNQLCSSWPKRDNAITSTPFLHATRRRSLTTWQHPRASPFLVIFHQHQSTMQADLHPKMTTRLLLENWLHWTNSNRDARTMSAAKNTILQRTFSKSKKRLTSMLRTVAM